MILCATDYRFFLGIPVKPESNMKRYLRLDWHGCRCRSVQQPSKGCMLRPSRRWVWLWRAV